MKFCYTSEPALPNDISQFEADYSLQLPDDYRHFLMSSNGGIPSLAWFEVPNIGSRRLCGFEPFSKNDTRGIRKLVRDYITELDRRYLPIATTFDGELVCIDTLRGQIVYTTGCAADFEANAAVSYHILADSFSGYLESLFTTGEADELDIVEVLAKAGNTELLEYFMRNQGTVDIRSKYGFTLAQHCAGSGNLSLLQECIRLGASRSCLIHAALKNHQMVLIEYLLSLSIDLNEVDRFGKKPMDYMRFYFGPSRQKLGELLHRYGQ